MDTSHQHECVCHPRIPITSPDQLEKMASQIPLEICLNEEMHPIIKLLYKAQECDESINGALEQMASIVRDMEGKLDFNPYSIDSIMKLKKDF